MAMNFRWFPVSRSARIGGWMALSLILSGCDEAGSPTPPAQAAQPSTKAVPAEPSPVPKQMEGFDLTGSLVPPGEIHSGGPGRDGIPAIDAPKFVNPASADFLQPEDLVVSVTIGAETRAYPLRVLVWHEIANDAIGTNRFSVTYCPLCGTSMVFGRDYGGPVLDFGVSGLLYNSDVLMYDRQTESLWSQLKMQAVTGSMKGRRLKWLPSEHLTFAAWRAKYPGGKVLSTDTGFKRSYGRMPYGSYERNQGVMFGVGNIRTELKNKDWVIGVIAGDRAYALPLVRMPSDQAIEVGDGKDLVAVRFDPETQAVSATEVAGGAVVPSVKAYWFAWQAFYPQTLVRPAK
jgi:hypothetical protein